MDMKELRIPLETAWTRIYLFIVGHRLLIVSLGSSTV